MKNKLSPKYYSALMHSLFAAAFLLPFTATSVYAQKSDTIGFGTTAAYIYGPAHISSIGTSNASYSTKTINLFTQSELATIGIYPGAVFNSIAWQKSGTGVMINGASLDIKVSLRSNIDSITYGTSITANKYINDYVGSNFTFAGSKLFSAAGSNFPTTTAWVPISFSVPYTYQGGALEVLMDAVYTPGPGATAPNAASAVINWFSSSTRPLYQCIYTNGVTSYANTTVYYYADSRVNTVFNFTPAVATCSGAPVAGAVKSTIVTACPGMLLANLRLKGASAASGIKLQWEKKVSGQSTFTPITGATKYELVQELIKAATEYRVVVTCGTGSSTTASIMVDPTPYITPNYTYDFETGAAWFASTVPGCWLTRKGLLEDTVEFMTTVSGYTTGTWASDGWKNVGTYGAAGI